MLVRVLAWHFARAPARSIVRGTLGWAISLGLGTSIVLGLEVEGWLLSIALSTTALATLVPRAQLTSNVQV